MWKFVSVNQLLKVERISLSRGAGVAAGKRLEFK
jgi:hypothetical protein